MTSERTNDDLIALTERMHAVKCTVDAWSDGGITTICAERSVLELLEQRRESPRSIGRPIPCETCTGFVDMHMPNCERAPRAEPVQTSGKQSVAGVAPHDSGAGTNTTPARGPEEAGISTPNSCVDAEPFEKGHIVNVRGMVTSVSETMIAVDFGGQASRYSKSGMWVPKDAAKHERWTAEEIAQIERDATQLEKDFGPATPDGCPADEEPSVVELLERTRSEAIEECIQIVRRQQHNARGARDLGVAIRQMQRLARGQNGGTDGA